MKRTFLSHLYRHPALLLAALLSPSAAALTCPAPGKDGVGTGITGVVNTYYPGSASAAAGATTLSLGTSTGASTSITPGDLLLVVQMQDATLTTTNSSAYGTVSAVGAGKYEYVVATSSSSGGGSVSIKGDGSGGGLINSYTDSAYTTSSGVKRFQVIRVPQYSSATLGAALSAPAWNGTTGGVVAIDVAGSLGLNSGSITVSGLGFRGGAGRGLSGATGGSNADFRNLAANNYHAQKGAGIAGTPQYVNNAGALLDTGVEGYPNGSTAQGAPGNAGGGGTDGNPTANDQNSGGGGGAGAGAGGKGGRTWSSQLDIGGRGGAGVTPTATALVMGGGGGAGTTNNSTGTPAGGFASSGAAGGGLVLVRAGSISGTGSITANGADANNTVLNDGSGGGGGGGSVLVTSGSALPSTLSIYANGGSGGTNTGGGAPHGPGGGGGGGAIVLSGTGPATLQRNGGAAGTTAAGGTDGTTFGAVNGSVGALITTATPTAIPGANGTSTCFPALTVTKTTSTPARVQSVDTAATYTVTVSNSGGGAVGVAVTDVLPSPLAYAGTAITPTYSGGASGPASVTGSGTTTAVFGTAGGSATTSFFIPNGGSVALTFPVNLNSATPGTYQNPATVAFSDPTRTGTQTVSPGGTYTAGGTAGGSNYVATSSTAEDVTVTPAADLAVTKTDGTASVYAGGSTTYTIRVTNNGPSSVTGAVLTDPAATGLSKTAVACSGTPGQCTTGTTPTVTQLQAGYALPALASGQVYELTVTTSVTATSGSVSNTATIATPSGTTDPTSGNNAATDTDTVTPATISVQKAIASAGGGRVASTDQFTVTAGSASVTTTGTGSSVTSAAATLSPATVGTAYTVSETAAGSASLASYTTTYACTNTLAGGQTPSGSGTTFTVTPAPGDALSCTFTNARKNATLTLRKTWSANSLSGNAMTVTTTGALNNATVTSTATAAGNTTTGTAVTVYAGEAITLPTETFTTGSAANYTAAVACTGTSGLSGSTLTVGAADTAIVCTYTNTRKSATLTLRKTWSANSLSGNSVTLSSTGLTNNASTPVSTVAGAATQTDTGTAVTVYAGDSGTLGETFTTGTASNYTTALACTGTSGLSGSTLTVGAADTAIVCTFTNTLKPDLSITKTHTGTWAQGDTGKTYTLTVSNVGGTASSGTVTVTDTLPTGLSATAISGTGWTCTLGTLTCTRNDALAVGGSYPAITVTVTVSSTAASTVTNTATVSGGGQNNTANDTASDATAITPVADLAVTKSDSATSVNAGGTTTYTIRVTNNAASSVTGAVLTDPAATGLTATSVQCSGTPGQCTTGTTPTITQLQAGYALPTLASGQVYELTVTATVTATSGSVSNTATVATPSGTTDPTSGNNAATDTDTVNPVADLSLTKTDGVTNVTPGSTTTYTITLTNNGPSSANNTVLTDPAATGLTKTSVSCAAAGGATCPLVTTLTLETTGVTIATLPAGGSITLTVVANVTASAGSVTNSVTATLPSGTTDPTPTGTVSDTDTVSPVADLAVTKTDGVSSVNAGGSTTYTIRVTNNGPSSVTGAVLTDPAATGLSKTAVACSGTPGQCTTGTTPTVTQLQAGYALPALASGQVYELTVTTSVTATSGSVSNTATIATPSGTTDPTSGNNAATDTDTVTPIADLAVTKTDGVSSVTAGGTTTYTIVLTNNGPSGAGGATLTDPAVSGLSKTGVSCTAAGGAACPTLSVGALESGVTIATLPAGGSITVTVTASVTATSGSVSNTATASVPSGTTDPTSGNNSATDTDTVTQLPDLTLTKTHTGTWAQGDTGKTYTLTVTNSGAGSTSGTVSVTDTLPTGLSATAISGTGWTCTLGTLTCTRSDVLAAGGSYPAITVTVTVASTAPASVTNTAAVSGGGQTNTANDAASDPTSITQLANLGITKTDGVSTFHVGSVLTYTVVVSNAGPSTASGATVSDPLPSGIAAANMTYTASASSGATTTVTGTKTGALSDTVTLAPGATVTYTVTITVPSGYAGGSLTNTATVTAPAGITDPITGNNSASDTDTREPPVANNDAAGTNPLVPVTFSVTNNDTGPVDPSTVDLDPSTAGTQTTFTDTGKGTYTVDSSGNVTFTPAAGFTSGTSSIPYTVKDFLGVSSNVATISVTVPAGADLSVGKSGPAYAAPGDTLTYTITVTNTTAIPATASTVTDTLASSLTFVSASSGGTYNSGTRTVTWTLPSVGANAQQVLTVTVTAPSAAQVRSGTTSVQNTATATLPGDPTSANNTSAPVTTRMILNEITKSVRNVTAGTAFGTTGGGKPGEVLEYCLAARNLGGVDLGTAQSGYTVRDALPANVQALATAYDAASGVSGTGIRVVRGSTTAYLTSASDGDAGILSSSGGTYGSGSLTVNLGIVTAGETVTTCFQATIR